MWSGAAAHAKTLNAARRPDQQGVTSPNRGWDAKIFQEES